MTDQSKSFKQLSAAEALRALYIDFEGRKDEAPVLLGVHRRGRGSRPYVQQDVVDETFAGLVPRYLPLRDCVENVVRRAEHGDRRIVSWSQHDLDVVRTLRRTRTRSSSFASRLAMPTHVRSPSDGATGATAETSPRTARSRTTSNLSATPCPTTPKRVTSGTRSGTCGHGWPAASP